MHILHTVLFTFPAADKENLFNNQELLYLVVISFIVGRNKMLQLVTLRDQRVNSFFFPQKKKKKKNSYQKGQENLIYY